MDTMSEYDQDIEPHQELVNVYEGQLCSELTLTEQRSLVFHLLYALDAFDYDVSLNTIAAMYKANIGLEIPENSYVFTAAHKVSTERHTIDAAIVPLIENWRLDRIGLATKLILRLAIWELMNSETDRAVVINEAVELAKDFGEKDSYKFINGILDQYVKKDPTAE